MLAATQPSHDEAFAKALAAGGPSAACGDALVLFGQFVGVWDFVWTGYDDNGEETETQDGEWIFGWVLEGRAVQDVWIVPARSTPGHDGTSAEYGTTIRFYDPRTDAWYVTWNGPVQGIRRTFIARRAGDEIVQEGETKDGRPMRWIFSEISENSFRWRSVYSRDDEKTWLLREQMAVRRR